MSERLKRNGYYPLCDTLTRDDCEALGLKRSEVTGPLPTFGGGAVVKGGLRRQIKATWTGEKRPPKAGEWYLSGAIIGAYRAPNDLSTPFHIARLAVTETRTETIEVEV
jgi:hypothetical protein